MDTSGGNSERLLQLLSLWSDGLLADEQFDELIAAASADEETRNLCVDYMFLHSMMHRAARLTNAMPPLPTELQMPADLPRAAADPPAPAHQAGTSPVLGFLGECFHQGASFLWKSSVFSILVAVGVPMAMFALVFVLVYETPPEPVAVVARSRDCAGRLDDRFTSFYPGSNLFEKQRLVLDKGLVEIQFADGVSAVLEGPATFEILGGNAGSLNRGRLAAVVPPEARGFAVETPSARVVDLGTEFGVLVDDHGRVEAHVFGGQVEVVMPPKAADVRGETALLTEGEAVHIATIDDPSKSSRIVRIPAAAEQFTRSVALPEPTILFAHHGSNDPTTEGWTASYRQFGEGFPRDGKRLGPPDLVTRPVNQDGTAAWLIRRLKDQQIVTYAIHDDSGLSPKLRAEARKNGWVLRTRVFIGGKSMSPNQIQNGSCAIGYRDGANGTWNIRIALNSNGDHVVLLTPAY